MQKFNSDSDGWTWVFRKNKQHNSKPIDNPFSKDLGKIATSFYVSNFPDSLDAKGFGRFLGVPHIEDFVKSLSNIWIDNHHLYVTISRFQRTPASRNIVANSDGKTEHSRPVMSANIPSHNKMKSSYVSVAKGESMSKEVSMDKDKTMSIHLTETDLVKVEDISKVANVVINKASYPVQVQEVSGWNILINDDIESTNTEDGHFDEECKSVNVAEKPLEDLDDILQPLEEEFETFVLQHKGKNHHGKVILFGDLNEVRDISERYGSLFSSGDDAIFNSFIQDSNLLDLPIGGKMFTWMNKAGTKLSKIDHFLISEDVLEAHSDIYVTILDKLWSDHNPILLHCNKTDFGPIPFRIFHSWFDRADFVDVVKEAWANLSNGEWGHNTAFHIKLKGLKQHLKQWYSQIKIFDNFRKKDVTNSLRTIEDLYDSGNATDDDRAQRITKLHELDNLEKLESLDLIQKARIKWDVEGDENSKYFHELVISLEEIRSAVWDCGSQKASGPDGFTFKFVKHFWDDIKLDIQSFMVKFFKSSKLPQGTNSAFITLIPKIPNPLFIKDCRPISLIGIQYNIIAKILANRLSKVIDSLVSQEQSAFISGRQILDGPLILSEIIDWYKIQKKKMLLFKIDFENAFDSVSWRYLDQAMCMMGFGFKWRNWIKSCLYYARTSILINGSPALEFSLKRGLRQGDPLSPFLFIIIMEGLHIALRDAMAANLFHGVKVGSSTLRLSHLLYADDVIIMSEWDKRDMKNIIHVLHVFYMASGLKININKSNLFGVGVSSEEIVSMATTSGCLSSSLPLTYLGLPIGSNMNRVASWKMLLDRFKNKLSGWKASLLSIGGRLTLIKSVLGSLGIYYMSIFKAPETVFKILESLRRWRMMKNPEALWVKVIKSIHGAEAGMDSNGCQTNGLWAKIIGAINHLHSSDLVPFSSIKYKVGDGSLIRFWIDTWAGISPLCDRFNRLFHLENSIECLIQDRFSNGSWSWDWTRPISSGRSHTDYIWMLDVIGSVELGQDSDSCTWSLSNDGTFSVSSLRHHIGDCLLPSFSSSTRCGSKVPIFSSYEDWISWFDSWHASKVSKERAFVIFAASC
ncbi:putative RNA-directed DNA polymerase, eukaryota, reverse transcriptase zinc-binding domain protein, partial [Tanacetum coccineum]